MPEIEAGSERRYPGVYRTSWGNRWFGQFRAGGRLHYVGTWEDPAECARAVEAAKAKLRPAPDGGPSDA